MGRREKPRTLMEQNRHLCGSICLCQLTVVLSCVSLIYLSVAIYMPSHRAFHSGFDPRPVMCQTVRTSDVNNCNWASCGEWCLTKTTGFCPQMHVTVRQNGTDLVLNNCTGLSNVSCPPADPTSVKRYNCNQGSECDNLYGVFNCSLGHCGNYSERFLCHYKADGIVLNTEKDNMKLNGFFECKKSICTKIRRPFSCDRYCSKITTTAMNVFLMHEDNLFTGECREAFALNRADGSEPGAPVNMTEVWHEDKSGGALLASCLSVVRVGNNSLRATDCINGTVLEESLIPQPYINFTTFWTLYGNSSRPLDPRGRFLPPQHSLTIYNQSRLYINLEGCVNTLRGECHDFRSTHGRDGVNQTAQSRFPCYYNPDDSFMAVARFDLGKTLRELLIATVVPSVLFVVSFVTLVCITKYVRVGDDGKMKCTLCRCCGRDGEGGGAGGGRDLDDDGPGPESLLMNS
ncbi:hypothetical protein ONE63_000582 [Megalurothrips usitatus]|uniref:Protein tipE n=1 Tax=Megalurothrips usitatus TaxID=439358 RepID=A0AAV7XZZ3_9NEOP|nr:hypothetical protein ONE63_000582 [Megalurothrips usitatus]